MKQYDIAIYGLGVMGASLGKNFISKGFATALYGKSEAERERFQAEGEFAVFQTEEDMVRSLKSPRTIFMMVTAGSVTDEVMERLIPLLDAGDILIDGGNSHFKDTQRRCERMAKEGMLFLGVGVSGGELGALLGPSMMAGGDKLAWNACGNILEKIAAKTEDGYCCDYLGKEGAGHYVKMVHNGIEYAMIQVIADMYSIMKDGLSLSQEEITRLFVEWQNTEVGCYLVEIAGAILGKKDADGLPLLDKILDVAKQKGTGSWTLEEGIARGVYIPTITESVFARYFSAEKEMRKTGSQILQAKTETISLENHGEKLRNALYLSMVACYAQGIDLIAKASEVYNWEINLPLAVSLWKEGCIIRSKMLPDIQKALEKSSKNIMLSEEFAVVSKYEADLREIAVIAIKAGIAVPTYLSVLSYYDNCRTEKMNVNMVQALRDCFGAHTYERIDMEGNFHTDWIGGNENENE
ncbi:NADP-dependent phosphogluconate dehydrogenase [Chakrabartyella piscis]|uniref:NADP-dependent phosphogluconate dehydrogenase n=1 Tax=Chakrabartyella piscis TaxID=2918914 RepID=UPI0029586CA3|nr:NADP-dependent phosphogluconate dehydrogenase [Chakrabartyella piscis]